MEKSKDGKISHERRKATRRKCRPRDVEPIASWLALAATFFINIFLVSVEVTFGILYDHLTDIYHTQRATIGWILSIHISSGCFVGLFVSPIISQYGCRVVTIAGLLLYAVGVSLSAVAPNVLTLMALYGGVAGAGMGAAMTSACTIIQQCFKANIGLANGIATLGYTAGVFAGPLFIQHLIETYGVSGTLLLHGAMYVQGLVFAMFLKTPKEHLSRGETEDASVKEVQSITERMSSFVSCDGSSSEDFINSDQQVERKVIDDEAQAELSRPEVQTNEANTVNSIVPKKPNNHVIVGHVLNGEASLHINDTHLNIAAHRVLSQRVNMQRKLKSFGSRILDCSLLRSPAYILVMLQYVTANMCRFAMFAHIAGAAVHQGLSADQAARVVSLAAVSNLSSKLVSMVLMNLPQMNPVLYAIGACIFYSCAAFIGILANDYKTFVCCTVLFGLAEGIYGSVCSLLIVHVVGVEKFPRALAFLMLIALPGMLLVVPFTGWLVDVTGGYFATFLHNTITAFLSVFINLGLFLFLFYKRSNVKDGTS